MLGSSILTLPATLTTSTTGCSRKGENRQSMTATMTASFRRDHLELCSVQQCVSRARRVPMANTRPEYFERCEKETDVSTREWHHGPTKDSARQAVGETSTKIARRAPVHPRRLTPARRRSSSRLKRRPTKCLG